MDEKEIIVAHVCGERCIHSVEDHLRQTARNAANFASEFGASQWGYLAGLWHDLGKYSPEFQSMIRIATGIDEETGNFVSKVNHSTAGAQWAIEKFNKAGRIFSYLIAGHHAGLPDWLPDETGNAALSIRLKEISHLEAAQKANIPQEILGKSFPTERPSKGSDPAMWIRMLFSCLVDADFLDTEAFMDKETFLLRGDYPSIAELLKAFTQFMDERYPPKPDDTPVNHIRTDVLKRCILKAADKPGAFTLSVPTGGGKTLSSMAFALHHAIHHQKRRIIYVIPYISIIEQTADQFQKIFGDAVIEHHANLDPAENDEEYTKRRLACENWDAPIIVTTAVQFFESLFASRTSKCRKLHNIVNSVVVLDEAQLLPPEFLNPILRALDELRKHYGVTLLLSTATQPALSPQKTPSFTFEGLSDTREIIENPDALNKQLKRVEVKILKPLDEPVEWEDLRDELVEHASVLCVVNRRDDCRKLWQLMPEGTFHLSALMCGAHRSDVIAAIRQNLKAGVPTRVISTQLVEAGVDIDFPVVYRALCGLDSVAQAAGRCNREGLLKQGHVFVFRPPTEPPVGHLRQAAGIGKRLLQKECADLISPQNFTEFFQELYWLQGENLDRHGILKDLAPDGEFRFSFRTAARKFKIIDDSRQASVIVAYGPGTELISELERREPDRYLMRRLQRYVVNLPRYLHDRLVSEGTIRMIHDGIYIQGHSAMYDKQIGFCPDRSAVYAPDDLIV